MILLLYKPCYKSKSFFLLRLTKTFFTKKRRFLSWSFSKTVDVSGVNFFPYILYAFCTFVIDSSGSYTESAHSFIFSFKNKDGLGPFKVLVSVNERAIYGGSGNGPTFGNGFDLKIANGAGSNTDSYTNLGKAYVQVAGYKYGASDTQSLLAGSYNFQPHEVEVFHQTYKN